MSIAPSGLTLRSPNTPWPPPRITPIRPGLRPSTVSRLARVSAESSSRTASAASSSDRSVSFVDQRLRSHAAGVGGEGGRVRPSRRPGGDDAGHDRDQRQQPDPDEQPAQAPVRARLVTRAAIRGATPGVGRRRAGIEERRLDRCQVGRARSRHSIAWARRAPRYSSLAGRPICSHVTAAVPRCRRIRWPARSSERHSSRRGQARATASWASWRVSPPAVTSRSSPSSRRPPGARARRPAVVAAAGRGRGRRRASPRPDGAAGRAAPRADATAGARTRPRPSV